ncbi:decapping and exoribonuclease protein-like isoform X2 [Penaeus indicus]|uniref:decapping and exoribonuclease protein-like isoform X2 n=1 Tax=Penaeus indicus TaxID=29960 RepID=UPI00300C72FD
MAQGYTARNNGFRGRARLDPYGEGEFNGVFRVGEADRYKGAPPEMKTPLVVGGYSVDCDRKIIHDRSKLKFLNKAFLPEEPMDVELDLKEGLEKAIDYQGNSQESFENLLRWVLRNQLSLVHEKSSQRLSIDILCFRGTLKKICASPYKPNNPWTIYVAEIKGSLYITPAVSETQPHPANKTNLWGNKFEQYLKGDPDDILNANEEYHSVLQLSVGGFSLLYSPEIDCADADAYREDHKDMSAFVLIKCLKDCTRTTYYYQRFRQSDWWLDNMLTGIPRIIVGKCTGDGVVNSMELFKTEDLPALAENEWDPDVYINFLVSFINFMKQKVAKDTTAVYMFERRARDNIYCSKLSEPASAFLPSWYTQKLLTKTNLTKETPKMQVKHG